MCIMYKIMLLDDDKFILASLQRSLRKEKDWLVEIFHDPVAALESVNQQHYDLIMSDYQMPVMSGIEFLAQVKRLQPETIRIILSGDASQELVHQAEVEADVHDFVCKPIKQPELIAKLTEAFNTYERVVKTGK